MAAQSLSPVSAGVTEAQARRDAAASAYGAGMARLELGLLTPRELGVLRGKVTRAENALSIARNHRPASPVSAALATPWRKDADGVYRATLADGRGVWAWAFASGDWRYGLLWGCEDVPCSYAAPRRHLAQADCLALASWIRPGTRPAMSADQLREWQVHPVTGPAAATPIANGLSA